MREKKCWKCKKLIDRHKGIITIIPKKGFLMFRRKIVLCIDCISSVKDILKSI